MANQMLSDAFRLDYIREEYADADVSGSAGLQ